MSCITTSIPEARPQHRAGRLSQGAYTVPQLDGQPIPSGAPGGGSELAGSGPTWVTGDTNGSPSPSGASEPFFNITFSVPQGGTREESGTQGADGWGLPLDPLPAPSLVSPRVMQPKAPPATACPFSRPVSGECQHRTVRWVMVPCRRRVCPVCGPARLAKVAARISHGLDSGGDPVPAAYFIGTWGKDVSKPQAVRTQQKFIRWLRRDLGVPLEYAAVWEVTRRGRLHINLVMTGWRYVPQRILARKWQRFGGGRVAWIESVGPSVAGEVAKPNRELAAYLGKLEQIVLTGRAVNFSRRWPKLPKPEPIPREGVIRWRMSSRDDVDFIGFGVQLTLGYWLGADQDGEWKRPRERCACFHLVPNPAPDTPIPEPPSSQPALL